MGIRKLVKKVLTEKENRRYEKLLAERAVSYEQWLLDRETDFREKAIREKRPIKDSSPWIWEAEFGGDGRYTIFYMRSGSLSTYARQLIADYFEKHPEVQILYGDEDVLGKEKPWFKPDWSPDLFDSWYYFGSLVAMRTSLAREFPCDLAFIVDDSSDRPSVENERFAAYMRTCLEACGGWKTGCKSIGHIPEILYHCVSEKVLTQYMQWETKKKAIFRIGKEAEVLRWEEVLESADTNTPLLSVVIPSKDHPHILEQCLNAIPKAAGTLQYEIIVVDNGSNEENKKPIEKLLQTFEQKATGQCAVKYIYQPMEFNFSKMCNMGAEASEGRFLLFLNDDVELYQESCLEKMAKLACREHVGAVGTKLYYPDSVKIQHAGITNLPMGPVHKLQFLEDDTTYYFNANHGKRNVLAVTAACLMVEKEKYLEVQGFSEELRVAFNDVCFCFKLCESGYFNVCDNDICAYHHESLSRGDDESLEKWKRLLAERDKLYANHPDLEGKDPYYGIGLGREGLDTRIRPAYETAGNKIQRKTGESGKKSQELWIKEFPPEKLSAYRQDNCLLLRVENCRQGVLQGYGVVLGDNNACYDKEILLEKVEEIYTENLENTGYVNKKADVIYYSIPIKGQYRPDLVENMPDQTNVGLSGFWIEVVADSADQEESGSVTCGSIPRGQYRIGMTARNRVTGLKLVNWSNRILTVE